MSTIIIGGGGGHNSATFTASLLKTAQTMALHMTADEHASIVDAERDLVDAINTVLANVNDRLKNGAK